MMRCESALPWLLGLALLDVVVGDPVAARPATSSCGDLTVRAQARALALDLRCNARAKRRGEVAATDCLARATRRLSATLARGGEACAASAPDLASALGGCAAVVLDELSGTGACATRKLMATSAASHGVVGARRRADRPSLLCQAFARAGTCPGDCTTIEAALAHCSAGGPPVVPADVQVVLFGTYEGDAISTTSVAGQDEETDTARVVIEPGDAELYVVLSSYESMIWRFEGATSRVGHVVLVGGGRSGVTGIAAERLTDLGTAGDTLSAGFYDPTSPQGLVARSALERALGRPVDAAGGSYSVGTVSLPSMAVVLDEPSFVAPPGFDPSVYWRGSIFSPGGVVDVDPAQVVSTSQVEPYEVLPQGFGLAQLVASGALENRDEYFYIARSIPRFPAGLYGAHAVSFVLGRDVPIPAGDPGHSCVISEETGLPLVGSPLCGTFSLPPRACTLPAAPAGDRVVLFGAYEGDAMSTVTLAGQDEETETARVVVAPGPDPLYVILSAYSSMIWRFEGAVSRVDRVVLVGNQPQGVTGLAADSVTNLSRTDSRTTDVECFSYFYDLQSPEGLGARAAVEHALGRPVDAVSGRYAVGTLALPSAVATAGAPSTGTPAGLDAAVFQMGLRFNPGGVTAIDPAQVVSSSPAVAYDVLPQAFGLAQLVGSGALEERGGYFYIARPIPRFPAGLYGAEAVSFVLGRGVPMPDGSPGHSCVRSEETGLPIANDLLCGFLFP